MPKTKIDKGRELYEADLVKFPTYATQPPQARPQWSDLPEVVRDAWRRKASGAS